MAINERERNLFHRIFFLLLTSIVYNTSEHQKCFSKENNKDVVLLATFYGNRLQLKFNKNLGYVIPRNTKNSVKTRALILIILAISGDVSSNPGPNQHRNSLKHHPCRKPKRGPNFPDCITGLSKSSRRNLVELKNLQRLAVKKELHVQYLQKYKTNDIIPPGLNIKKTPQIGYFKKQYKQTWENSLNESSKPLLDFTVLL